MNKFSEHKYSFDKIEVDPIAGLLKINGRSKRLEPKVVLLLSYFASHNNRVISRQELVDQLWPGIVVADETVTRSIFSLRNALGDDAKQPKYIETIPKKGYRFLAIPALDNQKRSSALIASSLVSLAVFIGILVIHQWQPASKIKIDKIF